MTVFSLLHFRLTVDLVFENDDLLSLIQNDNHLFPVIPGFT